MALARALMSAPSILLVDDNRHMLRTVSTILKGFGVGQVRESADAADAFAVMRDFTVDIVITDLRMEPLEGLDLVRLMRTAKDSPSNSTSLVAFNRGRGPSRVIGLLTSRA